MDQLAYRIDLAMGRVPADLVLKDVTIFSALTGERFQADLAIAQGRIVGWGKYAGHEQMDCRHLTVAPGFIDAHVHVESSLLTPTHFEEAVLTRGTVAAVCDPHELANVTGTAAFEYFLACAQKMVMDLYVNLSSCVPASPLETSGFHISAADLQNFVRRDGVLGLAEMMNFPGVLHSFPDVLEKLKLFAGRVIDGHAPLLGGEALNAYCSAGIQTDHECSSVSEALEKMRRGMKVLIREGSAARNLDALTPLLNDRWADSLAFCTDDRDTLEIVQQGHIDYLVRRAIANGAAPEVAYRVASASAARIYGLSDAGLIAPGYRADLVLVDDFERVGIVRVMKSGRWVDEHLFAGRKSAPATDFARRSVKRDKVDAELFQPPVKAGSENHVIGLSASSLLTEHLKLALPAPDTAMIAVLARHGVNDNVGQGWVKGFGLRDGALASSVGHDSHNICVVGDNRRDMAAAVNALIEMQGGFVVVRDGCVSAKVALPIGGLMSDLPPLLLAEELRNLYAAAARICTLESPFLQLSFLPLSVIPHLKLSDLGLVDVDAFQIIS